MQEETFHTTLMIRHLEKMRAGDSEARNELMERVVRRLHLLSQRMLRGFPRVERLTEADDILQSASLRLLRALECVQPSTTAEFFNLAAVQIRRELLDLARRYKNLPIDRADGDGQGSISTLSDAKCEPEDLESWEAFHQAVEQLESLDREIVSLLFYHGWTQDQVAELLQMNVRTIRRRWHASVQQLQEIVRKNEGEK